MNNFNPVVICSLHGFKSHGKWQKNLTDFISTKHLIGNSFDYGYQFSSCLIPGFKKRLIKKFYREYKALTKNKDYKIDNNNPLCRPSIIAHSLGSYILCYAMLKHHDIKFDKIILCGSIVDEHFYWDLLFKRNQVFFVRNEYSPIDKVVRWGWILSRSNSGQSGWKGFKFSSSTFEQEKFDYFDHGSFFEGNHIEEFWLPFLLKNPPTFQIKKGKEFETTTEFTQFFDQTEKIDDASFGNDIFWEEFSIPDGLAESWIETNPDIYSFLLSDTQSKDVIGYINAMPLKDKVFESLLSGELHDSDIKPEDIISYEDNVTNINLYIMSVALNPDFHSMHLGLKDVGFEKLYYSLLEKLSYYYTNKGIKVVKIAAVGWTD